MRKRLIDVDGRSGRSGFTLLEVLVSLILGSLIVGGLMGLISLSLHYQHRLKVKSQLHPLLEAAAEEILADPQKAGANFLSLGSGADAPQVNIRTARVELPQARGLSNSTGALYRVLLECRGQVLEFSLYFPPKGALDTNGIASEVASESSN